MDAKKKGNSDCRGFLHLWTIARQGSVVLETRAGWVGCYFFLLISISSFLLSHLFFFSFSISLDEYNILNGK